VKWESGGRLLAAACILVGIVNADVSTFNNYYAGSDEVVEEVTLRGMDYTNSVSISGTGVYGISEGNCTSEDGTCSFEDRLSMSSGSSGGLEGANIDVDAKEPGFGRTFGTSGDNNFAFSYRFGSGDALLGYFIPGTLFIEDISTDNSFFEGKITGSEDYLYASGTGSPISNDPSSFSHSITLGHAGKLARTEAFLNSYGEGEETAPAVYQWFSSAESDGDASWDDLEIDAYRGDLILEMGMIGTSDVFPYNQRAPEKPEDYPAIIYPGGTTLSDYLYMIWRINSSD